MPLTGRSLSPGAQRSGQNAIFPPRDQAPQQSGILSQSANRARANSSDKTGGKKQEIYGGEGPVRGRLDWTKKSPFKVKVISLAIAPTDGSKATQSAAKDEKNKQPMAPGSASVAGGKPSGMSAKLVATITFEAMNPAIFRSGTTLTDVRTKIMGALPKASPFVFCAEDGTPAQEQDDLNAYFARLKAAPRLDDMEYNVYVTVSDANPSLADAILSKPPFYLKFVRVLEQSGKFSVEGSLDASVFKGKSPAAMSLNDLRGFVKSMSADESQDIFCLQNGTPMQGHVTLSQYLTTTNPKISPAEKVPSIPICFKKAGMAVPKSAQEAGVDGSRVSAGSGGSGGGSQGGSGSFIGAADPSVMAELDKADLSFSDRSLSEVHRDKTDLAISDTLDARQYSANGGTPVLHTSKLNENDWDSILKNSNALYGWKIDYKGNKIVRAPHPAFKLRKGLNLDPVKKKAIVSPPKPEGDPEGAPDSEAAEIERMKNEPPTAEDLEEFMFPKPYGIPSYAINDRSKIEIASISHEFQQSMAENHFTASSFEIGGGASIGGVSIGASAGVSSSDENSKSSSDKSYSKTLVATYRIPRVTVHFPAEDLEPTEELKAHIEKVQKTKNLSELRKLTSLFGNLFCQQILLGGCLQTSKVLTGREVASESMERSKFKASVGLNVSVPGGPSANMKASHEKQDQKEQGSKTTDNTENLAFDATGGNTILAVDPPAWLESVADFNYWRVIEQSELTPISDVIAEIQGYEQVKMWFLQAIPTLNKYIVVPRSRTLDVRLKLNAELEGLSRALSNDPKALEISTTRETELAADANRRKLDTYLGHNPTKPPHAVRTYIQTRNEEGPDLKGAIRKEGRETVIDMTRYTYQVKTTTYDAIFSPASTQAPVLMSPKNMPEVTTVAPPTDPPTGPDPLAGGVLQTPANGPAPGALPVAGSIAPPPGQSAPKVTPSHKYTVWKFEIPYGYNLEHNSLVSIKSLATTLDPSPLALTVYRNGQGVFLPTITSNPDPCYWRVLKASGGKDGESLQDGEPIRLCWAFTDQASGYRDYKDDFYGRRRFKKPDDVKWDVLYMKAPFPRFEDIGSTEEGASLVMDGSDVTKPIARKLQLIDVDSPTKEVGVNYNLFDLSFRLDYVGGNGNGDISDYMNVSWGEHTVKGERILLDHLTRTWQDRQGDGPGIGKIVGSALLGPLGGLIGEGVDKRASGVSKKIDGITDGSPMDVVMNIVSLGASFTPIGAICSMFDW